MFVIELGEAGGHLSASRSGGSYHHQRAGGLDIVVSSISLIADDMLDVSGISLDFVVEIGRNREILQATAEIIGRFLPAILGNDNAAHIETALTEGVDGRITSSS